MSKKDTITYMLENAKGNTLDIYCEVYCVLKKDKDSAPKKLQELLEYPNKFGVNDDASKCVPKNQEEDLKKMYKKLLVDCTNTLVKDNLPKDEFYQKLWERIFEADVTSPDSKEKGGVCLKILNEEVPLLPYYQAIKPIRMSEEEYAKHVEAIAPKIQESIHMLNRRFEQRTEEASQFYRIIRELDKDDAVVYLASFLGILKNIYVYEGYSRAKKEMEKNAEQLE